MIIKDNTIITLEGPIMRRVYVVWVMRSVWRAPIWRLTILTATVWQLNTYASIAKVWANAPEAASWQEKYRFFLQAINQTELATKGFGLAALTIGGWLLWDMRRWLPVPRLRWFRFGRVASL